MSRRARMFGIKDIFTTINLFGGIIAICLCIDNRPFAAGLSVILGYLLGDTMDGWIARKLGTSNQFGAEFDTIADHTSHVIAPAAIVYTVYKDVGLVPSPWNQVLAIALAGSIVLSVSVRHARNIVAPIEFKGVWAGLPRSVLGFWAIGYCNATLAPHVLGGWWFGVVLIPALSIGTLTYLPFPNHRPGRRLRTAVGIAVVAFFLATFAVLIFKPAFTFDVLFFWMAGYSMSAWMSMTADERLAYQRVVKETKTQLRTQASG